MDTNKPLDDTLYLCVAGGRDFSDIQIIRDTVCTLIDAGFDKVEFVSGDAAGADRLGARVSSELGHSVKHFPAAWDDIQANPCVIGHRYGKPYNKLAGMNRNAAMVTYLQDKQYAVLVACWDGRSRGTENMIEVSRQKGIQTLVIKY